MYRRIEYISDRDNRPTNYFVARKDAEFMEGAMHYMPACEVMCDKGLPSPKNWVAENKSRRYYFTQRGWHLVGRHIIHKLKADHVRFRILKVKHRDVDLLYIDDYQVIVRPRKQRAGRRQRSPRHDHWD